MTLRKRFWIKCNYKNYSDSNYKILISSNCQIKNLNSTLRMFTRRRVLVIDIIMNTLSFAFKTLPVFFFVLVFMSCKQDNSTESAVARVGEKYLYAEELDGLVLPGTSKEDSLLIIDNFLNNWVKQQIMVQLAENNLSPDEKDFTKQMNDYRNSLLIYKYESSYISQKLDTIVSDKEIEEYYNTHQKEFELKNNIVRAVFLKINTDSVDRKVLPKLKKYIRSDSPRDRDSLDANAFRLASDFYLESEKWITFENLQNLVPVTTYNQESFLSGNSYFEITDRSWVYLIRILEYKIKETISPLNFEYNNVRDIIVKKRKLELLEKLRNDVFQKALRDKNFEIFNEKR